MEGAMFGMFGGGGGPLGEAQSLIYRACEERNPDRRIEMAFEAIRISPDCAVGDEDEAVAYAAESSDAWRETPGAREWLEAAPDSYEPPKSPSR
jgi:hypothetical protein